VSVYCISVGQLPDLKRGNTDCRHDDENSGKNEGKSVFISPFINDNSSFKEVVDHNMGEIIEWENVWRRQKRTK
jgi:hypothetical protein